MKYVEDHIGLEVDLVKEDNGNYIQFEWRDVVGYEGYYQVSNYGHVKTIARQFETSKGYMFKVKTKLLTQSDIEGYKRVSTENKHSGKFCKMVHRIVAEAFLTNFDEELEVDHIDRNRSNNVAWNLRMATSQQNNANTYFKKGTSSYKGVYYKPNTERWYAHIGYNKERIFLGSYLLEENAARAYNKKAKELYGEHAHLNDVSEKMEEEPVRIVPAFRPVVRLDTGKLYASTKKAAEDLGVTRYKIEQSCIKNIKVNGVELRYAPRVTSPKTMIKEK